MIRAVVAPKPPDDDRLAAVRAALPALEAGIYLNTGSVGPLPSETAAAMSEIEAYELATGRAHPDYWQEALQRMAEARAAVAAVLTADSSDIALTHSSTDGMSIAAWSIDWRAGDRAVTTSLEHPGGSLAEVTTRILVCPRTRATKERWRVRRAQRWYTSRAGRADRLHRQR